MASIVRFRSHVRFHLTPLAAAACMAGAGAAHAQDATATPAAQGPSTAQTAQTAQTAPSVQSVQVVGRGPAESAGVTGFAQPLARTPIQADSINANTLLDINAISLSDLTRLDASLTDSYNAVGYWTTFTLRGFQVDNRYNFRRDGLPINAETVLALDNKSDVEILKGLSGMQAGTSAPGGLVNLVVKRPDRDLRDAQLAWSQNGSVGASVDLSQRFGVDRQFGARVGVSADHLDPNVRDAKGHRQVLSLATDWRLDDAHLLEFEFEHNLQSQPSVPGFSMLGPVVPDPHSIDPHINLNDQPWSLPVVTQGNTMSLRYTQKLNDAWSFKVHALQQRLVSNDHLAFDYGLYSADGKTCDPCDRFGSDGQYSIWDFRSDGERRTTRDLDLSLSGAFATGPLQHALTTGVLVTRFTARFNDEAYNLVGTGNINGTAIVPSNPALTSQNVDRNERSTELYLRDAMQIGDGWTAWAGVRHTRLQRDTWPTSTGDPTTATDYAQSFTTPWLSLSKQLTPADMVYVSWGEGVESDVVANEPKVYVNAGEALPSTISKQWEAGYKHGDASGSWGVAAYDVEQPQEIDATTDVPVPGDTSGATLARRMLSGDIRSVGLEADAQTRIDALTLRASLMAQRVRNRGQDDAAVGKVPFNVPMRAVKLGASYAIAAVPGLSALMNVAYEGGREVLPDDSATIPGWTRFDLGARYTQQVGATTLVWRGGVDNVGDRRAWREAPYQYEHAYLFPLEPRTFYASLEAKF